MSLDVWHTLFPSTMQFVLVCAGVLAGGTVRAFTGFGGGDGVRGVTTQGSSAGSSAGGESGRFTARHASQITNPAPAKTRAAMKRLLPLSLAAIGAGCGLARNSR